MCGYTHVCQGIRGLKSGYYNNVCGEKRVNRSVYCQGCLCGLGIGDKSNTINIATMKLSKYFFGSTKMMPYAAVGMENGAIWCGIKLGYRINLNV